MNRCDSRHGLVLLLLVTSPSWSAQRVTIKKSLSNQAMLSRMANKQAEAFELAQKAAARGEAGGSRILADLYFEGAGVPRDHPEALRLYTELFEKSAGAARGAELANRCAYLHGAGVGIPRDLARARRWFEKSLAISEGNKTLSLENRQARAGLQALQDGVALPAPPDLQYSAAWHSRIAAEKVKAPPAADTTESGGPRPPPVETTGKMKSPPPASPSAPRIPPGTTFNTGALSSRGGGFTHLVESFDTRTGMYAVTVRRPASASDDHSGVEITHTVMRPEDLERLPGRATDRRLCDACGGTRFVSRPKIDPETGKQYYSSRMSFDQYNGGPGQGIQAGMYGTKSYSAVFESVTCSLCKGKGEQTWE